MQMTIPSFIRKAITDVVGIATSKEKLKRLWRTPLYSNAIYLMIARVGTPLLGFAFWVIVARLYSPEDVGLASATIAAMMLLTAFSHLGLGYGLIRFLPHSGKSANSMINTCFTICTLTSIAVALTFIAGLSFWAPALLFLRQNPVHLIAFVIFVIASTLSILTDQIFMAQRRANLTLARSLIFGLLRLPMLILLAGFFHSFGIFASWGISLGIALLLSILVLLPRARPGYQPILAVTREAVDELLHFSLANYIGILLWSAPLLVLPIMVVNLLGPELNAYFYIAFAIGGVLFSIPFAGSTSLFVEGSYTEERLDINLWRSLRMVFVILVPAVILVLAFADKLLLVFGTLYAENASTLLRILAVSALPLAINIIYLGLKMVEKKLRVIVVMTAFVAVVSLGLSFLLLPRIGINGAGVAWIISHGILASVIVISFLKRRQSLFIC